MVPNILPLGNPQTFDIRSLLYGEDIQE